MLLNEWNVNDPLRDQKLQAAREIGWSESTGLLPGQWAQQNNMQDLFRANKYAVTGGRAGTLDGWGGGGASFGDQGQVTSQSRIMDDGSQSTFLTPGAVQSNTPVSLFGGQVQLGDGFTGLNFSTAMDQQANPYAANINALTYNGQNYMLNGGGMGMMPGFGMLPSMPMSWNGTPPSNGGSPGFGPNPWNFGGTDIWNFQQPQQGVGQMAAPQKAGGASTHPWGGPFGFTNPFSTTAY